MSDLRENFLAFAEQTAPAAGEVQVVEVYVFGLGPGFLCALLGRLQKLRRVPVLAGTCVEYDGLHGCPPFFVWNPGPIAPPAGSAGLRPAALKDLRVVFEEVDEVALVFPAVTKQLQFIPVFAQQCAHGDIGGKSGFEIVTVSVY